MFVKKPTEALVKWQDMELGVIIHYLADVYDPDFKEIKTAKVRDALKPENMNPKNLDVDQWIRSAKKLGAKYAVLVANHCTGFSLWQTKANAYGVRSMKWKDGKGDICRDFVKACKKYDILPGFYYSTGCNGYYDISDSVKQDYRSEKYRNYVKVVEEQVTELWTEYGKLFEIWFDGGIVPKEIGGPDIFPLLKKYQPDAVCFQGPNEFENVLRWVGNENGLAPENCWATTNAGENRYDGTVSNEQAGVGDPDGKYYHPAETDMPNRSKKAFGGGWAWKAGEEDTVFSSDHLLDCYLRSVGRNSNLLLGMGISTDGDFKDEAQFEEFGKLLRDTFGTPAAILDDPEYSENGIYSLKPDKPETVRFVSVREDIRQGQRVREFGIEINGKEVYSSFCIGHKRIIRLDEPTEIKELKLVIMKDTGNHKIRDIVFFH